MFGAQVRVDRRRGASPHVVRKPSSAKSLECDRPRTTLAGGIPVSRSESLCEENMKNLIARFVREEEGQDLIEYSLLAALIAVVAIAAMTALGLEIVDIFDFITAELVNAQI